MRESDAVSDKCITKKIYIDFDPIHFSSYVTHSYLTESNHKRAIEILERANAKNQTIRFGQMGSGLKKINSSSGCEYKSRGVSELEEFDGKMAIYSFYNPV